MQKKIAVRHCLSGTVFDDLPIVMQGRLEPPFRRRNTPELVARKAAQVQTCTAFI
jgi:hypothetical protein